MTYEVRTAVFEGPLDLLLTLINRHQVDVASVSLSGLVGEYLEYLDGMADLDLEVTSEFLLIAATLIQLKAKSLLPEDEVLDLDEELLLRAERDRLLAKLLQCVTFKDVAAVLAFRLEENRHLVPRLGGIDQDIRISSRDIDIPVDGGGLARLASRVLAGRTPAIDLDHLDLGLPSVQDAINDLRQRVEAEATTTFELVVGDMNHRAQVIAYFLALLELARWGLVAVSQDVWTSPIAIEHRRSAEIVSEWR